MTHERGSQGLVLTMIMALSSESPLTIVFTVEYRIGLTHPERPKKYHAANLVLESISNQGRFHDKTEMPCLLQSLRYVPDDHAERTEQ
jgi:hypothetical protein